MPGRGPRAVGCTALCRHHVPDPRLCRGHDHCSIRLPNWVYQLGSRLLKSTKSVVSRWMDGWMDGRTDGWLGGRQPRIHVIGWRAIERVPSKIGRLFLSWAERAERVRVPRKQELWQGKISQGDIPTAIPRNRSGILRWRVSGQSPFGFEPRTIPDQTALEPEPLSEPLKSGNHQPLSSLCSWLETP